MASKCGLASESVRDKWDRSGRIKRPMNAFLIFCKRQRGSVRRKYPLLENREVTRVLGEWWAALGTADKSLYSALAHQHKENLIRSHPELKWYKQKMPSGGKTKKLPEISQPGIVPGKLADESQLGGLSSLLQLDKEVVVREEEKPPVPKPLKKRYRDEIYTMEETQPIVEVKPVVENKVEEKTEIPRPMPEVNEEEEERLKMWRTHILEENNNVKQSRDRACKGQRYREFMWTTYSNRRRANRWELNQDKNEIPVKKTKTVKSEKNKLSKISNSDEKADNTLSLNSNDLTNKKKKKITKANNTVDINVSINNNNNASLISNNLNNTSKSINLENNSCDILPLIIESDSDDAINVSPNGTMNNKDELRGKSETTVVGSRKRKARRQEIRRLEPGSTFKGVDVISENDIAKL